jgi:hypothetical protein
MPWPLGARRFRWQRLLIISACLTIATMFSVAFFRALPSNFEAIPGTTLFQYSPSESEVSLIPLISQTSSLLLFNKIQQPPTPDLRPLAFLNGPPTTTFRGWFPCSFVSLSCLIRVLENLRNDTKYITSFVSAGWSESLHPL